MGAIINEFTSTICFMTGYNLLLSPTRFSLKNIILQSPSMSYYRYNIIRLQLRDRGSNLASGLRVFREVRKWIGFDFVTTGFGQDDRIIEAAF